MPIKHSGQSLPEFARRSMCRSKNPVGGRFGQMPAYEQRVRAGLLGVAAVAGGLAGIHYGSIPERWLDALHDRKRIEDIAKRLVTLSHH